ncbi:TPM domain-containing protein [Moraxella oculi]|uniref:TPM domain-containing protein n=2 Tax=Moraxella oculi TaxID=2940516 RepID=A0ABW8U5D7_9GAMM
MFIPVLHNRWLNDEVRQSLTAAISQAELGHRGEIYLLIENHLPITQAYHMGCRERALELFALHRVWDTAENTGVMIYVNVCEHDLEIIADRGIDGCVDEMLWQELTKKALMMCQQGCFAQALLGLVADIGELLCVHYPSDDISGNELSNDVVFLK